MYFPDQPLTSLASWLVNNLLKFAWHVPQALPRLHIATTVPSNEEVSIINQCIEKARNAKIVIYGKNTNDETVQKKYNQLIGLGFTNVYIYSGGLFEWLLLQDIFGEENFPTTTKELDILKYKAKSAFSMNYLMNID